MTATKATYDGDESDAERPNRKDRETRPPEFAHGASKPGLHLAAKLAAAETCVGITSGQLDAWRAYGAALLELVDRPEPDRRPGGRRGERRDSPPPAEGARPQPADAPFFTQRLADRAIERGEKAKALKTATAALHPVLTPEQVVKLRHAERTFLPRRPKGPDNDRTNSRRWQGDLPRHPMLPPPFED